MFRGTGGSEILAPQQVETAVGYAMDENGLDTERILVAGEERGWQ